MGRLTTPDGVAVSYDRYGSGPPLVLVHGSLTDHTSAWMVVKPLLGRQFTVSAVARRGRGETSATEAHTILDEAADLVTVIEAIGEPVFVLGHSFGAHVALAAAALIPHTVRKLILYEPPWPRAMAEHLTRLQTLMAKGEAEAMVDDMLSNAAKVPRDQVDLIRTTPFWQFMVADAQNSIREWPGLATLDFDVGRFRTLQVPVLLLKGSESSAQVYASDALAAALPNVRVVEFAGQGHVAQWVAPQMFVETVSKFLLG